MRDHGAATRDAILKVMYGPQGSTAHQEHRTPALAEQLGVPHTQVITAVRELFALQLLKDKGQGDGFIIAELTPTGIEWAQKLR